MMAIGPVYIAPIFNTYTPLKPVRFETTFCAVAHANGIRRRRSTRWTPQGRRHG